MRFPDYPYDRELNEELWCLDEEDPCDATFSTYEQQANHRHERPPEE